MQTPSITLPEVPQEYLPLLDWMFTALIIFTALWIVSTVFIVWRRQASGLTPVQAARMNKNARPDFLDGDKKKRKEAIARGEAYDRELEKAEADRREIERNAGREPLTATRRLLRILSVLMAVFGLATAISTVVFQVTYISGLLKQVSAGDAIMQMVQKHPIGVTVAVLVILYNLITFFTDKKWKPGEQA